MTCTLSVLKDANAIQFIVYNINGHIYVHTIHLIDVLINIVQDINIHNDKSGEVLALRRAATKTLSLATNRAWIVSFGQFNITFPYNYRFSDCFDEVHFFNFIITITSTILK